MANNFGKMKILAVLLAVVSLFSVVSGAESTTLTYSYGDEAFNKHMLDIRNTTTYNGTKWIFEQGAFSFEGAFMMYGGNTRTVYECEVPEFRRQGVLPGENLYLGKAEIRPPQKMELYVFSGDRTTGEYALTDHQAGIGTYALDIYAGRDEKGTFRLTDKVFLYAYEQNGQWKNYAASLYISFENYDAAPADTSPENAVIQETVASGNNQNAQTDDGKLENYARMITILEAENKMLSEEIAMLKAQGSQMSDEMLGQLKGENDALSGEVEACHAVITEMDQEIIRLNEEIAKAQSLAETIQALEAEKAELAEKIEQYEETIKNKNLELSEMDVNLKLNVSYVGLLKAESEKLTAENDELKALIESLQAENEQLKAEAEKGAHLITDSDTEVSSLGKTEDAVSVKETADSKTASGNTNPVSGKSISVRPDEEKPAAELSVTALPETVYRGRNADKGDDWFGWDVTFSIENVSNVPFTPECAIVTYYNGETIVERVVLSYQDLRPHMGNDRLIKGNDPLSWGFGWTDFDLTHVTFMIRGTDANGHAVEAEKTAIVLKETREEAEASQEEPAAENEEEDASLNEVEEPSEDTQEETTAYEHRGQVIVLSAAEEEPAEIPEPEEIPETEEIPCGLCADGKISCTVRGYTVCPSCRKVTSGYHDACELCRGAGFTQCSSCRGSGKRTCSNCNGHPITNPKTKEEVIRKMDCEILGCRNGYVDCFYCDNGYGLCVFCFGSGESLALKPYCDRCNLKLVCGGCFGEDHQSFPCPNCTETETPDFVYESAMRNYEQFIGTEYRLTGSVGAVERKADGLYTFRLRQDDDGIARTLQIQLLQNPNEARILEGDRVTMYGRLVPVDDQNLPLFIVYSASVEE